MARIFVVDDDIFTLKAIKRILIRDDLEVDTCNNNEEAIDILSKKSYDLVLMDIVMPGKNGFELCEIISEKFKYLPIILMTALIDEDVIKKAFAKGATDFIRKPIRHAELYCRINRLIENERNIKKIKDLNSSMLEELKIAMTVQDYLLPYWCKLFDNTLITSFRYASNLITGDLFNYKRISKDKYLIYAAETQGGSIKGALIFSAVNAILSSKISLDPNNSLKFIILKLLDVINNAVETSAISAIIGVYDVKENSFSYVSIGDILLFTLNYKTSKVNQIIIPVKLKSGVSRNEQDFSLNRIELEDNEAITVCSTGVFKAKNANGEELSTNLFEKLVKENISKYNINVNILSYFVAYSVTSNGFRFNTDSSILTFSKYHNINENIIRIPRESFGSIKREISSKIKNFNISDTMKDDLEYLCSLVIRKNAVDYLSKGFLIIVKIEEYELNLEFIYLTKLKPNEDFNLLKNKFKNILSKDNKRIINIYECDNNIFGSLRSEKLKVRIKEKND